MAKRTTKKSGPTVFDGSEQIVVLTGKDHFLRGEYLKRLRAALGEKHGEVETLRFENNAPLADVLDELRSFGLMQQHKVAVVDEADVWVTRWRTQLEDYAANPAESGTLVLRVDKWQSTTKLHKAIVGKIGAVAKAEPPTLAQAETWVRKRGEAEHGVKVPARAAVLLVDHIGADLGRLDTELAKLAVGCEPGGSIAVEQIEALVGHASDEMAWEIQSALLSGDPNEALGKLHELIELAGHHEVLIAFAVSDMMRKLNHAATMMAGRMNEFAIAKQLKVWPRERQEPFMAAARKLGRRRAAALLEGLVDMVRRSRSGFGDASINLERFCVQFADALR